MACGVIDCCAGFQQGFVNAGMVSAFMGEPISECNVSCPMEMPWRSQMSCNH